ncbi:MAG: CRTAC1 family protein, partial [Armatimonadetes bacterium]|nr:CRTAC1 family protein [Armatimonadota bacterium]
NQGSGRFREVAAVGPDLPRALCGRALCVGDLDNDGRLDLLAPDLDGEPLLLRNLTPGNRHWLRVRLVSRRVTEGARVVARAGERIWRRRAGTGGSYLSAGDPRVHLGLEGHARLDELRVEWPGGGVTVRRDVPADQEVLVTEGATATPR